MVAAVRRYLSQCAGNNGSAQRAWHSLSPSSRISASKYGETRVVGIVVKNGMVSHRMSYRGMSRHAADLRRGGFEEWEINRQASKRWRQPNRHKLRGVRP